MNETTLRLIKKYPNRRLYDTTISSYITLEDVRRLVVNQIPIKIIDARSQNDITHSTLLQIIIEQEENGPALFTIDSLQQMIRFYGGSMQDMLRKMFEYGMNFFVQQNGDIKQPIAENLMGTNEEFSKKDPLSVMTDFTQKNVQHWQSVQQQWMQSILSGFKESATPDNKEDKQGYTNESFTGHEPSLEEG